MGVRCGGVGLGGVGLGGGGGLRCLLVDVVHAEGFDTVFSEDDLFGRIDVAETDIDEVFGGDYAAR